MRAYFILFVSLFLYFANHLQAQKYSSQKLAEIGELFPKQCLPLTDSIFDCTQIIKNKSFIIQYNTKKEIVHLGISLFSPETKKMINLPVCNFIERITLELLLLKTDENINKKLQEYNISLEEDRKESGKNQIISIKKLLDNLKQPVRFVLHQQDEIFYAYWIQKTGEEYLLTFPASRELIFGTNKKESDLTLGELLLENSCGHLLKSNITVQKSELEILPNNSTVFIKKGDLFYLPELNADTYYLLDANGMYQLVTDEKNPALFLKNLLLIPQLQTTLKLHVKHRMYGSFTPEFEMKPSNFICFFQPEFDIYCHVDDSKDDLLKATVVLYNRMFSYMHLLSITTDVNQLFQENGILETEFFSNIPQHNIKNLFKN